MLGHAAAEDLLKQHSIPELRLLQEKLHKEASGKKQELQSMVGSRYHDFIQSADAITVMRNKSELMGEKLASFQRCSSELVVATNKLLSGKERGKGSTDLSSPSSSSEPPTSSRIWTMLEKCDIFNAGLSVQVARLLLGDFGSCAGQYLTQADSTKAALKRLIPKAMERNCSLSVFLQQTVVEDARLLLNTSGLTATEQAQTLAVLGLLGNMQRADLLSRFFESATLMLGEAEGDDDDRGDDTSDDGLGSQAKNLLKSVRILQKTILDAHTLFFKTSSSQQAGPEGVRSRAVQEWTTLLKPTGLLAVQQLVFLDELLSRFKQSLPTGASTEAEALGFDKAGFDAKELRATGQAELKRLFDKWLSDAVRRVSDRSRRVLGGMASAAQVARLQQLVYECSTTVSAGSAYTAEDWHAASLDLLASPRLRARLEKEKEKDIADVSGDSKAARSTTAADDPPKLLWSTSLRAPFMMQVERLLRASCQAVVTRTREQLISALEAEGISVDTFSLQVSVSSSSHQPTLNAASSLRLFRRAEAIRSQLEGDILQLVGDVVRHPAGSAGSGASGGGSDPQSSAALSRAFYVQASQLLAQVAVALRTLGASLARTLESSGGSAASSSCGAQRLLSGLLLVGRLAWLLKIRGRFLDVALVAPGVAVASSSGGSASAGGTQPSDLSSEDQLRSALEIADTNGDGVVTYSEAVEAVQALAVGDTDESGTAGGVSVPQTPFLSMLLTPTLTFAEMAMLCAHLLSPETCRPELRLRSCLEELLTSTHRAWCTFVVGDLGTALAEELSVELGLRGHAHFRALWTLRSVEGDERERLLVPSSCSAAMSRFCMSLNQRSSASLVSIDTVQALPPPADAASSRLSVQVLAMLHTAALESVVAQYTAVLATRDADAAEGERVGAAAKGPGSAARKLARERLLEDCALQACFDLSVLEAVAGRCCVTAPRGLRVAQQGWAARLDPINAQLLGPLLQIAARTFSARSFLLFPGVRALGSGSSSASAAASAAAEEDAVAGIFASGVGVGSQRDRDAAPCRFSLLPLAISSGRGGGADAEAADGVVTASAKSRTKGNKASQESGGGLSKTLITSLGSILG